MLIVRISAEKFNHETSLWSMFFFVVASSSFLPDKKQVDLPFCVELNQFKDSAYNAD